MDWYRVGMYGEQLSSKEDIWADSIQEEKHEQMEVERAG